MYIVEGNIGAGKSTFLQLIGKHMPHVSIALEPLNNWQSQIYGQSLLTNFYQNPKRWAYTLETLTLMCRIKEHLSEQELKTPLRLVERSIYSGNYCFAKNGFEHGFLTDIEWRMYGEWFDFLTKKCAIPQGFIYLKVSPEVAYARIKKRNRLSEEKITLSYIEQIDQKHEEFLFGQKGISEKLKHVPLLTLDCDIEFEDNTEQLNRHIEQLQAFFQKTA
jgi:deoxyadenosine/deoxycytidine kinase